MGERRDHGDLTAEERRRFVEAVHQLKANGAYDRYVAEYRRVFEAGGPARCGPAWLPWHRELLHQFELDVRTIDPSLRLPYWDWTTDRSAGSPLWDDGFLGGAGAGPDTAVIDGPFGLDRWVLAETSAPVDPGPALRRTLGPTPALPTAAQVDAVLCQTPYERFSASLDRLLRANVVPWVGRTMASATAPNDPAFWPHATNVDRIWALWQQRHPDEAAYLEAGRGAVGHRLDDAFAMAGRTCRPRDLLHHRSLGYSYDSDLPGDTVLLAVGAPPVRSTIDAAGAPDHYQFVVVSAGTYAIEVDGPPGLELTVSGPDDPSALVRRDASDADDRLRTEVDLTAGSYLVRVVHGDAAGAGRSYRLAVRAAGPQRPVADLPVEGAEVEAQLGGAQSDVYTFAVTRPATYVVEVDRTGGVHMTLAGPNCPRSRLPVQDDSGPGRPSSTVVDLASGVYYLHVRSYEPNGTRAYRVSVRRGGG